MGDWTDKRVERLKTLWAEGLSASQIAAELGGVTRNAVIGKVCRLGLAARRRITASNRPSPLPGPIRTSKLNPYRARTAPLPPPDGVDGPESDTPFDPGLEAAVPAYGAAAFDPAGCTAPVEQRKTMLTVNGHDCHWPFGEPGTGEFFFCGAATQGDAVYCRAHAAIAYETVAEHRNQRKFVWRRPL